MRSVWSIKYSGDSGDFSGMFELAQKNKQANAGRSHSLLKSGTDKSYSKHLMEFVKKFSGMTR